MLKKQRAIFVGQIFGGSQIAWSSAIPTLRGAWRIPFAIVTVRRIEFFPSVHGLIAHRKVLGGGDAMTTPGEISSAILETDWARPPRAPLSA